MDRLNEILRCQWRAYWRRVKRATSLAMGHQGITLIIAILVFFKYLGVVTSAGDRLARGDTTIIKSLFAVIFLAWLFLALSSRAQISLSGFRHLPLSLLALFVIRIWSILITPYAWLVMAASLAIFYPLTYAPSPLAAMTVALLFITFSCLLGLIVAHLFSTVLFRRLFFALVLLSIATSYFIRERLPASAALSGDQTAVPFRDNALLVVAGLVILNAGAFAAAVWSLHLALMSESKRRTRRGVSSVLFNLRGSIGTLAAKDVRYFRTLLDPYLGLLASALGCVYLIGGETPTLSVALIFVVIVFVPNCPLAFNSFGLDTRDAWERYAVLPVTGTTVIHAKNVAFLMIASVQLAPIVLLTAWRMGASAGLIVLLTSFSVAFAYLALGNWMSISLPARMFPFRFAPATGSLPEIIAGILLGSLPGILVVYLQRSGAWSGLWPTLLILAGFAGIYFGITTWSGRRFERHRERLALAVAIR